MSQNSIAVWLETLRGKGPLNTGDQAGAVPRHWKNSWFSKLLCAKFENCSLIQIRFVPIRASTARYTLIYKARLTTCRTANLCSALFLFISQDGLMRRRGAYGCIHCGGSRQQGTARARHRRGHWHRHGRRCNDWRGLAHNPIPQSFGSARRPREGGQGKTTSNEGSRSVASARSHA